MNQATSIIGCLLGTALGDAVGLPAEGLTASRQRKLLGDVNGPAFFLGRGMVSDDTEHLCMTAQALLVAAGDVVRFEKALAAQLRAWIACLPAGTGLATLKACLKLCAGIPPSRSGVFSAGNGPSMRSAIIGVCHGDDLDTLRAFVRASTRLTHTDPKAEYGALAVALAAHVACKMETVTPESLLALLMNALPTEAGELFSFIEKVAVSVNAGQETITFAQELGLGHGVSGYTYHTVPVALHAWLSHQQDVRTAILSVVRCGGDADSTGAITGGLAGAGVGEDGIPRDWLEHLGEWPRDVRWMQSLGHRLGEVCATGQPHPMLPVPIGKVLARNAAFTTIVLGHGLRRLLPPY